MPLRDMPLRGGPGGRRGGRGIRQHDLLAGAKIVEQTPDGGLAPGGIVFELLDQPADRSAAAGFCR
jgi:hypothetical protein